MSKTLPNGLPAVTRAGLLADDRLVDQINDRLGRLATVVEPGTTSDVSQTIPGTFVVGSDPEQNDGEDGGTVVNVGVGGDGGADLTDIIARLERIESCFPVVTEVECVDSSLEVTKCDL